MPRIFSNATVAGIPSATCSDRGRHSFKDMRMPTVLVVEDEEHLRATLAYNLRKAGYAVQTAAAGPEAIRMFQAHAPDLVLLDVMLPGFDGFEVCRRLRQSSSVPIKSLQGDRWALAHRG